MSAPRTDAGNFDEYCSNGELAAADDNWKPADIIDRCRELSLRIRKKKITIEKYSSLSLTDHSKMIDH